jgi:hypothetical protein
LQVGKPVPFPSSETGPSHLVTGPHAEPCPNQALQSSFVPIHTAGVPETPSHTSLCPLSIPSCRLEGRFWKIWRPQSPGGSTLLKGKPQASLGRMQVLSPGCPGPGNAHPPGTGSVCSPEEAPTWRGLTTLKAVGMGREERASWSALHPPWDVLSTVGWPTLGTPGIFPTIP